MGKGTFFIKQIIGIAQVWVTWAWAVPVCWNFNGFGKCFNITKEDFVEILKIPAFGYFFLSFQKNLQILYYRLSILLIF